MKVFISYGSATDQVIALRLQALAAVNGLSAYVPPAYTRQGMVPMLDLEVAPKLAESDVILGVVATGLSPACQQELTWALNAGKNPIVMAYPQFVEMLGTYFTPNLVVVDPVNPELSEMGILHHLKALHQQKTASMQEGAAIALVGLATLALGLLMLTPSKKA